MPADFEKKFKTGRNGEVMLEKPGGGFENVATVPDGAVTISAFPSDQGPGKLVMGDQELSVLARPGVNRLLKIPPTRVATPYSESNRIVNNFLLLRPYHHFYRIPFSNIF